jgi:uncharacterized tellurite resistance protein B-like protein
MGPGRHYTERMSLLRFFGLEPQESSPASGDPETLRKIVSALDSLPVERARYVAALAAMLSRVARADFVISEEETREMERIVTEIGHLTPEQAILVVQMAKTQNLLFGATENFLVTREFGKMATPEQKIDVLRCLFAVSAADQSISGDEEHVTRQIARELLIEHEDYIKVRTDFRQYLSFLQKPIENPST